MLAVGSACGRAFNDPLAGWGGEPEVASITILPVDIEVASKVVVVAEATVPAVVAYSSPDVLTAQVGQFANPLPTGGPLVFQVVDRDQSGQWLEVLLPVRPNGTTGWIHSDAVSLAENPYRIDVDISDHRLTVSRQGEVLVGTDVAIGTGETPTPIGEFYLTALLQPSSPNGRYGAYAFGLSGFSETLREFNGGDGVIGIHGTNEPESLGTDVSHGCIRLHNDVITELAQYLPLGTPVTIRN